MFSKHGKTALVLAFFILVFTACRDKGSKSISGKSRFEDTGKKALVILSVQESLYLNSDFERYLRFTIGEDFRSLPLLSLSRLLDNFIEERILLEAAKGESVSLTDEEQKAYLAKVSNEAMLKNRKIPLGEVEAELLLERLLIEKYIFEVVKDIEVEDEEIKEYYELHRREFLRPERVEVSQILLKSEERAVELLKVMKESPHFDFKTVAQKESEGVEASKGGKMGVFEMGQLPEEMEKVIFSLSPGELSPVVESAYGYHIFRLDRRYAPELIPEEEAASAIRVQILDQKIKSRISDHISGLKQRMEWKFHQSNLFFPYQRNTNE